MKKNKVPTRRQLEKSIGEWKSAGPQVVARVKARNEKMRVERATKDAKFTARANADDLEAFKRIAANQRIPYQTLLGHILHKYVVGDLVDVEEIRKVIPSLGRKSGPNR